MKQPTLFKIVKNDGYEVQVVVELDVPAILGEIEYRGKQGIREEGAAQIL